jgi:hypothetical protein
MTGRRFSLPFSPDAAFSLSLYLSLSPSCTRCGADAEENGGSNNANNAHTPHTSNTGAVDAAEDEEALTLDDTADPRPNSVCIPKRTPLS